MCEFLLLRASVDTGAQNEFRILKIEFAGVPTKDSMKTRDLSESEIKKNIASLIAFSVADSNWISDPIQLNSRKT